MILQERFSIQTSRRCEMIDITSRIGEIIRKGRIKDGSVLIFCPHTTAGITINENADPDVVHDILLTLDGLIQKNRISYRHNEGNSDAHVKSSLVGASEHIMISHSELVLGTWQAVYFCEFDGPRSRNVIVQVMGE